MERVGVNWLLLVFQLFNLGLLCAWIVLGFVALRRLGRSNMREVMRLGWAMVILLVPVFGAVVFLLSRPPTLRNIE